MKLFVDTSSSEKIIVGLGGQTVEGGARQRAQQLLNIIEKQLAQKQKSLFDITEIEVKVGPGSFTGLRVGVSVANALGWALAVPVNGRDIGREGPIEPRYRKM